MKNVKNITLISFTLITVSCSTQNKTITYDENSPAPKSQQRGGERGGRDIFEMDTNNDGMLSKSEVKGPIANDFDKIDTNGDGYISKEEFEAAPKPERGAQGGGRPPQR